MNSHRDLSTCGALHSFGSDFSGTRGKSDACQNGSVRSDKTISKRKEGEGTPMSMAEVSSLMNIHSFASNRPMEVLLLLLCIFCSL